MDVGENTLVTTSHIADYAAMAISHGNHIKKTRVTEKESDFEDSGSEVELGDDSEAESGEDYELESEDGGDVEDIEQEWEEEDSGLNEVVEGKPDENDAKDMAQEDISSVADQAAALVKSVVKNTRVIDDVSDESEMDSGDADDDDDFGDDESDKDDDSDKDHKSNKGKDKEGGNRGLANVMAKILATKKSDNVILSKAKKDKKFIKEAEDLSDDSFEIVDDSGKVKKEPKIKEEKEDKLGTQLAHETELQRKIWARRFRVKPDIKEDREKERRLRVLATQGVVQLFSAIEKHKRLVQKKISESRSVMEREKILETTGKEAFLEVLRQQGKKVKLSQEEEFVQQETKEEPVEIPVKKKPRWNVLADNFYKEPTLQSWDQQSDDED